MAETEAQGEAKAAAATPPMEEVGLALQAKRAFLLWLAGFREACCLHRVFIFCRRSKMLTIRTGQCFLLNGLIFLGSLFVLNTVIKRTLLWILPAQCKQFGPQNLCNSDATIKLHSSLHSILIELCYIFWVYPLYLFSLILSTIWYNDIAKYAFLAMESQGLTDSANKKVSSNVASKDRPVGFEGVIIGIGEQLYSALLLAIFFIEVLATGYVPFIGKPLNFLLLSWMYAYYNFEYKWNLSQLSLDKRLNFFETNWAFFAGFGSPCILAIFFFSPLVSYGVMAILYPLFVLTATGTHEEKVVDSVRKSWRGEGPRKIPIFYAADTISMKLLQLFPEDHNKRQ